MDNAKNWLLSLLTESSIVTGGTAPSLNIVQAFLDALDRPDKKYQYRIIIGGTAGKGTTTRIIEDLLLRGKQTVTTLMSPHIQSITERIRHNGALIASNDFVQAIDVIKTTAEKINKTPSYYEAIVLAGIWSGAQKKHQILLCEVGLGGTFDAVNAVEGDRLAGLTFIGNDHIDILGPTLKDIAQTKAGIFTKDCIYGATCEQIYYSEIQKVSQVNIECIKGIKQKMNKKLARKITKKILGDACPDAQKLALPARWEKCPNNTILDGSHSLPRFEYMKKKIHKLSAKKSIVLIAGIAANHDPKSFVPIMPYVSEIIWTKASHARSFTDTKELQDQYKKGTTNDDPLAAYQFAQTQFPDHTILVTGSFYLCGNIREQFYPTQKILDQQTEFPN